MARKSLGIPTADSPLVTIDDFSLIKGIGPILSKRLHKAGIYTYNQLAVFSPAALAEKVSGLSAKQITKQDWTDQAHKLAKRKTPSKNLQKVKTQRNFHQHYENFTIELLLDEKNRMRRTRVVHIQSGDADTWSDWETDQLIDFIARHARVHVPSKRPEKLDVLAVERLAHMKPDSISNSMEVKRPEPLSLFSDIRETSSDAEITKPTTQSLVKGNFVGMLRLQDFRVLTIDSDTPIHSLRRDHPYYARLTLDLANVSAPGDVPLRCKTTIIFKQLGGASHLVAEDTSLIELSKCVTLDIICANSQPGLYRPNACVRLFSEERDLGLTASLIGELIQVS